MAIVEMVMPKMGESIMEGTILKWNKKAGDSIDQDESVLEIATDKVDSEVPAPAGGKITQLLAEEGQTVAVGTVIALIETADTGSSNTPSPTISAPASSSNGTSVPVQAAVQVIQEQVQQAAAVLDKPISGRFYSPLVLNIAREEKISMDELDRVAGSGSEGRVTKKDILAYIQTRGSALPSAPSISNSASAVAPIAKASPTSPSGNNLIEIKPKTYSFSGEMEVVEMDRMRKIIAENMVYSKHVSPHVTSFVEADVSNLVLWRERNKKEFEKKYGEKLTFTPMFMEALVKAIREYPGINISVEGTNILYKKNINVGMAVALPSGNLIVPVIKNADRLNLVGLAAAVNDLANRARINKLTPDDLSDGTYTLTNVGTFGNVMGTPVILQPQVAILAAGAIRKKPAVIETPAGDTLGIRQFMFLSHSYDHRVVDGMLGGTFVRKVADYLENWDLNREV
jgi:2-oxoglutarate dehydrogenase E2 component (dihydrolipoamide succinyltransferase)